MLLVREDAVGPVAAAVVTAAVTTTAAAAAAAAVGLEGVDIVFNTRLDRDQSAGLRRGDAEVVTAPSVLLPPCLLPVAVTHSAM